MSSLHIALATDDNYAIHAGAAIHSLLEANPDDDVVVHLLHGTDVSQTSLERLRVVTHAGGGDLVAHHVAATEVAGLPTMARIGPVMWYRTRLPEILPDRSRVLYLDADVIVRRPLRPLVEWPLAEDRWFAAVDNVLLDPWRDRARILGLPEEQGYFNSGVLVLDLDKLRRHDAAEKLRTFASKHGERLLWPDQDALNVVWGAHREPLHPRWNCQNTLFLHVDLATQLFGETTVREARDDPAIVHFEGDDYAKPWHYRCRHPLRDEYFAHVAGTPWRRPRIEGRTLRSVAERYLPRSVLEAAHRWR